MACAPQCLSLAPRSPLAHLERCESEDVLQVRIGNVTLEMLRQEFLDAERRRTIDLMQDHEKVPSPEIRLFHSPRAFFALSSAGAMGHPPMPANTTRVCSCWAPLWNLLFFSRTHVHTQ